MQKTVLILGASSKICHEAARVWARKNYNFILAGRSANKIEVISKDLVAYGAGEVRKEIVDLGDISAIEKFSNKITSGSTSIDLILIGHGIMHDQELAKADAQMVESEIKVNFLSCALFLTQIRPWLMKNPGIRIGVITSVAGDRGRQSNYIYGSSKAGLSAFVDGFRADLALKQVSVTNIKPGPVLTPMTAHLKARGANLASAQVVGQDIVTAIQRGRRSLYTPIKWALIMFVIRLIPSIIFDKLKI